MVFSMDFVLYSTACGYDIEKSIYYCNNDYCDILNKYGFHWYTKKVKLYGKTESAVFVTINSAEDFIALSKAFNEELIIKTDQPCFNFYELEIYDDYRE